MHNFASQQRLMTCSFDSGDLGHLNLEDKSEQIQLASTTNDTRSFNNPFEVLERQEPEFSIGWVTDEEEDEELNLMMPKREIQVVKRADNLIFRASSSDSESEDSSEDETPKIDLTLQEEAIPVTPLSRLDNV